MQGYSNFKPLLPPYWIYAVAIGHLIFEFQLGHHLQLTYWLPMATYACPLGANWKCVWNDNTALQQGVVAVARQARLSWLLIADARLLKLQANNVWFKKTVTIHSSDTVLWIVIVFLNQTLPPPYWIDEVAIGHSRFEFQVGHHLWLFVCWILGSGVARIKIKLTTHSRCKAAQTSCQDCLHIGYMWWL